MEKSELLNSAKKIIEDEVEVCIQRIKEYR